MKMIIITLAMIMIAAGVLHASMMLEAIKDTLQEIAKKLDN